MGLKWNNKCGSTAYVMQSSMCRLSNEQISRKADKEYEICTLTRPVSFIIILKNPDTAISTVDLSLTVS